MNIHNALGLSFAILDNGSIQHIEVDPIRISLKAATPYCPSGTNLYLRKRTEPFEFTALLGPQSPSRFQVKPDAFLAQGSWGGVDYTCALQLSPTSRSWQWRVDMTYTGSEPVLLDLIYVQDVGLKSIGQGLVNQYYVSQYLERRVFEHPAHGSVVCCRQNLKESGGHPWLMVACQAAVAGSVDGMQFYGKTYRESGIPEGLLADTLGGDCAGESSVVALQEQPFRLSPQESHRSLFVATYLPDHPQATSDSDLTQLAGLFGQFAAEVPCADPSGMFSPTPNIFNTSAFLPVDDLSDADLERSFGPERRHCEREQGRLLSFFCAKNSHVMLRAKEISVDRPHGHMMQARAGYAPDENIVSTTTFAFGVFNSQLTQGNTNFNILLSVCTSPFNLSPESGQRIFVELEGRFYLLGVPSAFEMGLNHCRWIYQHGKHCFQVRTWTSPSAPQVNMNFQVLRGAPVKLWVTHDFDALNGWTITPAPTSGEYLALPRVDSPVAQKFPRAQFRMLVNGAHTPEQLAGLFLLKVAKTAQFSMSFVGEVCSPAEVLSMDNPQERWRADGREAQSLWQDLSLHLSLSSLQADAAAIQEILPWYGMNALVHFLTPHGLEQFSGAAWGTRDVAQGPLDLLLTMEKYAQARQVLRLIFSNQEPQGGWPQWWMFDSYADIRAADAHGDVVYWVIIALSDYIKVTGDLQILDEVVPFYGGAESASISEHVERIIHLIIASFIPGTAFVPFGGGDWNDSLQPVSQELAQRLISSWTVEMNYQAFMQYHSVHVQTGNTEKAQELKSICEKIKADFNQYLVKDGIVAGYGLVETDHSISVLLHPSDNQTGIHYSLLPMDRGIISEIFTPDQVQRHQEIIEQHLMGPDGARLMDRPLRYTGGLQRIFQRAESSTFFGREIGLMYVHEHIRFAESQARIGRADAFLKALRQAIPVAYRDIVPCGDIRQSNCYYSSSDVTFKTRYEADERYHEIKTGDLTLKGGWRIYSSGPGIYISTIVARLLGLRVEFGNVIIDPVIPRSLDGLSASMNFLGHSVSFKYLIKENCFSPRAITVNGKPIPFAHEHNRYRQGGAAIPTERWLASLNQESNLVEITL